MEPTRTETHEPADATANPAAQIHEDIDRSLKQRTQPRGSLRARVEERLKRPATRAWRAMKKRPSIGVIAVGGLGLLAADAIGVGEIVTGVALGYAAYQVLRKGASIDTAVKETEALLHGEP